MASEEMRKRAEAIKTEDPFMKEAIREAFEGISNGHGGPFGAVVVKDGRIIGRGHNRVLSDHDPTCHGEVSAIRDACRNLGTHDLSGSVIYTTGEPCPMCLFACIWANISRIIYGATIEDNAMIGFRDEEMSKMIMSRDMLKDFEVCADRDACLELFDIYLELEHTIY